MTEPFSVLIVGCGNIAGDYDEQCGTEAVLTHAGAYNQDPRFQIRACVEPDVARRENFMEYWSIKKGFDDLASCLAASDKFDVISLCMPTHAHAEALELILPMSPGCVFVEKPLTADLVRSRKIIDAYSAAGIPLAVNYMRRWDESMKRLRDELKSGAWGKVQAISGIYAKGIFNCGSHFFDLLHFLVGPLDPRAVFSRVRDGRFEDPTYSVLLETKNGAPVTLMGTDGNSYFSFEIDLVMEKGRLTLEDLGGRLRCRKVQLHPIYQGQPTLAEGDWQNTGLSIALARAVSNIFDHLVLGVPLESNGKSALEAEELCGQIMMMAKEGDAV